MKRITITSILAICMACPSFADIAANNNSPTCDSNTIGATSGTTSLEAEWTANTINLDWDPKNGGAHGSTTCSYDGGITLPTQPTAPTGYEFAGWAVRETIQQCSLSGLDTSVNSTWDAQHTRWKPINGDSGTTMKSEGWYGANSSDLNNGEWAVTFSYGTVKGVSLCSKTYGTFATAGTPDESGTGVYCWCKGTGLAEPNSSEYCPVASSSWAYNVNYSIMGADGCAYECAKGCADNVYKDADYRRALYGQ